MISIFIDGNVQVQSQRGADKHAVPVMLENQIQWGVEYEMRSTSDEEAKS